MRFDGGQRPSPGSVVPGMRRGRSSSDPFAELVLIFGDLPWWASIVGAVVVYVLLGLLVPAISGKGIGGIFTADLMRVLAPIISGLILLAGAIGALYRWIDRRVAARRGPGKT